MSGWWLTLADSITGYKCMACQGWDSHPCQGYCLRIVAKLVLMVIVCDRLLYSLIIAKGVAFCHIHNNHVFEKGAA